MRGLTTQPRGARPWVASSTDAALVESAFRRHVERFFPPLFAPDDGTPLVVHPDGDWFRPPHGERVDCRRRRVIKRLLSALVRVRLDDPGAHLRGVELVAASWPGERMGESSARNRLHVAVATLRRLGLDRVLQSEEGGYRLDPEVPVIRRETG